MLTKADRDQIANLTAWADRSRPPGVTDAARLQAIFAIAGRHIHRRKTLRGKVKAGEIVFREIHEELGKWALQS